MCVCVGFSGAVVSCLFVRLTIFSEIFDRRMLWLNGFSFFSSSSFFICMYTYVGNIGSFKENFKIGWNV